MDEGTIRAPIAATGALIRAAFLAPTSDPDRWCQAIRVEAETRLEHTRAGVAVFEPDRPRTMPAWVNDDLARAHRLHEPLDATRCVRDAEGARSTDGEPMSRHFARVLAPVPATRTARTFVMQVERVDNRALVAWLVHALPTIADACAEAYAHAYARLADHRADLMSRLNAKQRLVAPLLVEGLSEPEVAERTGRSRHTVHDHVKKIYAAWDVRTRLEMRDLWYMRTPALLTIR